MAIESLCKPRVVTVERNATLKNVSGLMRKEHVGCVVVTEMRKGKKTPVGVITDRDIALALDSSQNPQDVLVERIMQGDPVTASATDGVYETVLKMRVNGVRRVPVLNEEGSLCGIICADDLLLLMGEEMNSLARIIDSEVQREQGDWLPSEQRKSA